MQQQKMSLFAAILMNINIMVGAGIYIGPATMAKIAGNASYLNWPLVALVFFPVVWSIGQLAKLFPGQGSFYVYVKQSLGPFAGFISSWLYFLGYASVGALQSIGLREVITSQLNVQLLHNHPLIFNVCFLAAIALLNMLNLALVARLQSSATIFKIIPLLFVLSVFIFYFQPHLAIVTTSSLPLLLKSLPVALFGFWGFEACCSISHLIKGDKRNAYRAILLGFFATVLIYTFFHLGLLSIMGAKNLALYGVSSFVPFLNFTSPMLQTLLNALIASSICMAYIGGVFGCFLAISALLHALAQERTFFFSQKLSETNTHGRPWPTILLFGTTSFLFSVIFTYKEPLFAMTNLGILTTFFLTLFSLLLIQLRSKTYGQASMTILAFFSCSLLSYYSWQLIGPNTMGRLINITPLLIITLLGSYMFWMQQRKRA